MAKQKTVWKFALGVKLRDRVTGMEGVATSRIEYLNGCIQYCVKPKIDKDGKMQDGYYLDEAQLELVDKGINVKQKPTGGPMRREPAR